MPSSDEINSRASSLATSLLPSEDEDDYFEEEHRPLWHPPPRPPPIHSEPDHTKLSHYAAWAFAAFFSLLFIPIILLRRPDVGSPPTCRKAASMIAFSSTNLEYLSKSKHPGLNQTGDVLVIWSGMGHHRRLQNDTVAFDLQTRRWSKIQSGKPDKHSTKVAYPNARWKAASTPLTHPKTGLLVSFGDETQVESQKRFSNELWMLQVPSLTWQAASIVGNVGPEGRRGHTAVTIEPAAAVEEEEEEKNTQLVIFGGVLPNDKDLDETWVADISWPNVTWAKLDFSSASAAELPAARHGHTATIRKTAEQEESMYEMIVFGGRDGTQYYNDLWSLKLVGDGSWQWEELEVDARSAVPPSRAHHAAAIYNDHLYIWGGLAGPTFASSKPLDDLWVFNFAARRWTKGISYGATPFPRFLFSQAVHQTSAKTAPMLYIFGGESLDKCKLNDVWALNLDTLRWELLAPNFFSKRRCDVLFGQRGSRPSLRR